MKIGVNIGLTGALTGIALLVAGCDNQNQATTAPAGGSSAAPIPAPAGQDWTETVAETPQGGFVMGNPEAPVKLVEYASLTCPHCAAFSREASDELEEMVRSGRVSWEFRNFVLNPIDIAASLLVRCQGAGPFFALTEQAFAEQDSWLKGYTTIPPAEAQRLSGLPESQQFAALAKLGGLDTFFGTRGVPAARANACLADKAALDKLVALRDLGTNQDKVTGTPSFLINGTLVPETSDWATLEPKLRAAGG